MTDDPDSTATAPPEAPVALAAPHATDPSATPEPLVAPQSWRVRPRRSRWRRALAWAGLVVLLALAARTVQGVRATFAEQEALAAEDERRFETVPLLTDEDKQRLRRSLNAVHLRHAEAFGVPPPADRAAADSLTERYGLVPLQTSRLYVVLPGRHSVPRLTPSAAASLDSVAVRFRQGLAAYGLPPFRFAVSSTWRTAADQAALRGGNANAAAGTSSHEYATTYDLTYNPTRYSPAPDALPPPPRVDARVIPPLRGLVRAAVARRQADALDRLAADYPSRLTALLGRALIALEDEGVLVVIREVRQPVFHVTLARRLVARPPDA